EPPNTFGPAAGPAPRGILRNCNQRKKEKEQIMLRQRLYLGLGILVLGLLAAGAFLISPKGTEASKQVGANQPYTTTYPGVAPAVHFDISPPLRDMKIIPPGFNTKNENEDIETIKHSPNLAQVADPVVQKIKGALTIPTPIVSFNGPPNLCGGCA